MFAIHPGYFLLYGSSTCTQLNFKRIRKIFEMKKNLDFFKPFVFDMAACCGSHHTITLSNDGTLHSFGQNGLGQLGLGHKYDVSLPKTISNLPQIS